MLTKTKTNIFSVILSIYAIFTLNAQVVVEGEITLQWDDNSDNEYGFCIERTINSSGIWAPLDSVDADVTEYGPFSFVSPDTHHVRVYAYNELGNSGHTNIISIIFSNAETAAPTINEINRTPESNIQLDWSAINGAVGYNIYYSNEPYFIPDKTGGSNRIAENMIDQDPVAEGIQWIDTDRQVGNHAENFFYVISALTQNGESGFSNRVGVFDFHLVTSPTTQFNEIALPLAVPGINNAQDLLTAIPGCTSVARWNSNLQCYEQYVPGIPPTNFSVEMGHPYYVNITGDTVVTLMGEFTDPSFNLVTTSTTNFNEIMLPLDKSHITKASQLMEDILSCNSIAYWDASIQAYQQYVPGIPPTDFDVRVGYPYYVNVNSDVAWPGGGVSKRVNSVSAISQNGNGTHAPHIVWGKIRTEGNTSIENGIHFSAFVTSRPDEKLTENSPGCKLENGYWLVQCGGFKSAWNAGEILRIMFEEKQGEKKIEIEIELTYDSADEAEVIYFEKDQYLPQDYGFDQNYPNPFNPRTTIPYQISRDGRVKISIYNKLGQEICTLVDEVKEQGNHEVVWNGRDLNNNTVSSDMYMVRMESAKFVQSRKILLIK